MRQMSSAIEQTWFAEFSKLDRGGRRPLLAHPCRRPMQRHVRSWRKLTLHLGVSVGQQPELIGCTSEGNTGLRAAPLSPSQ
jgi:hypothetical protein